MNFRPCAVVPTYENPLTIGKVVRALAEKDLDVIVVDDGSSAQGRRAVAALLDVPRVHCLYRESNGGKGKAAVDGFAHARSLGFSHALLMDADGQHCIDDVQEFLEKSRTHPTALVAGEPVFDESVPKARLIGRKISVFWCAIETGGLRINDPLCGYRVYPLDSWAKLGALGARMDFDPEIAVRLCWRGVPIINLRTKVIYPKAEDGGVSHFRMFRDNVRISWMHTRLVTMALLLLLTFPLRRLFSRRESSSEPVAR
jgi:glycosyltransferase involved in cell wall biosynthesis